MCIVIVVIHYFYFENEFFYRKNRPERPGQSFIPMGTGTVMLLYIPIRKVNNNTYYHVLLPEGISRKSANIGV